MRQCVLLLLIFVGSCTANPATKSYDFMVVSEDYEYQLGRDTKKAMSKSKFYKSQEQQRYFRNLAQQIYDVGERTDKNFSFYLLDDDSINAAATPGYMFMNRGLLPFVQDEAALMGIMAHEAGHINARHTAKKISTDVAKDWAMGGLFFITPKKIEKDAFNMAYSRKLEHEADELAIRYLSYLGVPPANMITTYQSFNTHRQIQVDLANLNENLKIKKKNVADILDTHPMPSNRANIIEEHSKHRKLVTPYKQAEFYKQIDGIEYGYSGKGKKDLYVTNNLDIKEDSMAGVYGFKNTAYMKKQGLKVNLPSDYQARIMTSDPLGYNYKKNIAVSVFEKSDDKSITALHMIAELLGLKGKRKADFIKDVQRKKPNGYVIMLTEELGNKLSLNEHMFKVAIGPNWLSELMGMDTSYYYFYVKQLNDLDKLGEHNDYENNFRFIVLSSNSKKSFDETMLDDILFIKDNLQTLTSQEKQQIKPLAIKTMQATGFESIEELSEENIPYINFSQEWFKLINGLYNSFDMEVKQGQWLKLIPNPNKNI